MKVLLVSGCIQSRGILVSALAGFTAICFGDGLPLVQTTHPDFAGSGNCAACHTSLRDASGKDVSIDTHWRSTMMANAAKDPFWQAKVSSEVLRTPGLQSVIEDKCATCHMPMARTQAKVLGLPATILGDGFLNEANPFHSLAMDGVSCSLCHQITEAGLGEAISFSGGYQIDTTTESPNRLIYGPFPDPFPNQMRNSMGFTPVEGAQISQSRLCGACHTLETPFVDASGAVMGTFPEQMTYLEWEHSQFNGPAPDGRTCQDCHMPVADGGVVLSNRGGGGLNLPARSPFSQHHFVGGNALMLDLLSENLDEFQVTASTQQFDDTRIRLISQMQSATASLSVTGIRAADDSLEVGLRVTNLAGHKFPSGFPSRRAWLHFCVMDGQGQVIFDSGRPDEEGRITGNDADFIPSACEPHYHVVARPDQVQVYESVMENTDGEVTYTLLRGASYRKDNRLLPKGFERASADERIAVYGDAASDPNFSAGQDDIGYRVSTRGHEGPFVVEIKLYYQPVSAAFAADLRQDSSSRISRFNELFDTADKSPVTVASLAFSLDPSDFFHLSVAPAEQEERIELAITGPAGRNVDLEQSTDLIHWQVLKTFEQTAEPSIFEDPEMNTAAQSFYRLSWPLEVPD
jgi:hypothetical protein